MAAAKKRNSKRKTKSTPAAAFNKRKRTLNRTGGLQSVERKFTDTFLGGTAIQQTGTLVSPGNGLTQCVQDDTESGRDGRKTTVLSLHGRGNLVLQSAGAFREPEQVLLILCMDTQTNGTQMTYAQLMDIPTTSLGPLGFRNLENTQRFKVLWTKRITLNGATVGNSAGSAPVEKSWKFDVPVGVNQMWTGTGGTVSSIKDNSFHLWAISQLNSSVNCHGAFRCRFVG